MTTITNKTDFNGSQLDQLAQFTYDYDKSGSPTTSHGNRSGSDGFSKIEKRDFNYERSTA